MPRWTFHIFGGWGLGAETTLQLVSQSWERPRGVFCYITNCCFLVVWVQVQHFSNMKQEVQCGQFADRMAPVRSTRGSDTIATISWLGGFKQLAERVDYGELNTGTSVPESMTGRLVKPNPCQTSSGQIWQLSCRLLSVDVRPPIRNLLKFRSWKEKKDNRECYRLNVSLHSYLLFE